MNNQLRKYHLSYDTIDSKNDFENYNEAKEFILCVINSSSIKLISSPNNSTFILSYPSSVQPQKIFDHFRNNLKSYFHYSISLIAMENNSLYNYIDGNPNDSLNSTLEEDIKDLKCTNLSKKIIDFPNS